MANKIESRQSGDGMEIVRLISTDRDIVVPDTIDEGIDDPFIIRLVIVVVS